MRQGTPHLKAWWPFCVHFREKKMKLLSTSILAIALLAGCGGSDDPPTVLPATPTPTQTVNGALVGPEGMSLYVFDKDTVGNGKSVCNGKCASDWPPLAAADDSLAYGQYSVITRDEGTKQWAYSGAPLYYWYKDVKPGDQTGDGVGGVWHIARP